MIRSRRTRVTERSEGAKAKRFFPKKQPLHRGARKEPSETKKIVPTSIHTQGLRPAAGRADARPPAYPAPAASINHTRNNDVQSSAMS